MVHKLLNNIALHQKLHSRFPDGGHRCAVARSRVPESNASKAYATDREGTNSVNQSKDAKRKMDVSGPESAHAIYANLRSSPKHITRSRARARHALPINGINATRYSTECVPHAWVVRRHARSANTASWQLCFADASLSSHPAQHARCRQDRALQVCARQQASHPQLPRLTVLNPSIRARRAKSDSM